MNADSENDSTALGVGSPLEKMNAALIRLERKIQRVVKQRDALADALAALLTNDAIVCVCPPADLDIGGRGHLADCDTAIARAALRKAGRLP